MVTADIPYSGDKTVNGKYSDKERMENRWVSYDTDRIHRLAYDPGQAYPVKKIVLYHIKCNVLHNTGEPRFSAAEGFVQRRTATLEFQARVSHSDAFSLSNAAVTIPFFSCRS